MTKRTFFVAALSMFSTSGLTYAEALPKAYIIEIDRISMNQPAVYTAAEIVSSPAEISIKNTFVFTGEKKLSYKVANKPGVDTKTFKPNDMVRIVAVTESGELSLCPTLKNITELGKVCFDKNNSQSQTLKLTRRGQTLAEVRGKVREVVWKSASVEEVKKNPFILFNVDDLVFKTNNGEKLNYRLYITNDLSTYHSGYLCPGADGFYRLSNSETFTYRMMSTQTAHKVSIYPIDLRGNYKAYEQTIDLTTIQGDIDESEVLAHTNEIKIKPKCLNESVTSSVSLKLSVYVVSNLYY